jgi:RNA polymerase sigma-70 factor (ECF subfamily)
LLKAFGRNTLASPHQLSCFLESVERRAFKQAMFAVRDEEAALDIVQDAMLKLAEKYGDRPDEEFPMLFQRILQNTIRDFYRRSRCARCGQPCFPRSRQMTTRITTLETLAADEDDAGPRTPESAPASPDAKSDRRRNKKCQRVNGKPS